VVYGLYEISIFLVAYVEKKRIARLKAEGLWDEDMDDDDVTEDELAGEPEPDDPKDP
jgi:sec-independent protein translocase protein TatC